MPLHSPAYCWWVALLACLGLYLAPNTAGAQCNACNSGLQEPGPTLTVDTTWQSANLEVGRYRLLFVDAGYTYTFSNDVAQTGANTSYPGNLVVMDHPAGNVLAQAFVNGNGQSTPATVSWTATYTGVIRVRLAERLCLGVILSGNCVGTACNCQTPGTAYRADFLHRKSPPPKPSCPTTPTPQNGDSAHPLAQALAWVNATTGPTRTSYSLYLGTNNPPTNLANGAVLGPLATTYPPSGLVANTTYYWQLRPNDALGSNTTCPVWRFGTYLPAPASAPSPTNGDTLVPFGPLTLSWGASPGPGVTGYRVSVGRAPSDTDLVFDTLVAGTSLGLPSLPGGQAYRWRVQAVNPVGRSANPVVWTFRTRDTLRPGALAAPALVCGNQVPPGIAQAQPASGTGPLRYLWNTTRGDTNTGPLFTLGPGGTDTTFAAPLPATTWFRRGVIDAANDTAWTPWVRQQVVPRPVATFTSPTDTVCTSTRTDSLRPTVAVAGGTFRLNGSTLGVATGPAPVFAWPAAGAMYTLTYVRDSLGCRDSSSRSFRVVQAPPVVFTAFDTALCRSSAPVTWVASPGGGSWLLNGAPLSFPLSPPAVGQHWVRYEVGNPTCPGIREDTLMVYPKPFAGFTGLDTGYCTTTRPDSLRLTVATLGGIWEANGDTLGTATDTTNAFPWPADTGQLRLVYRTKLAGCTDSFVANSNLRAPPSIVPLSWDTLLCTGQPPVVWAANPAGGQWRLNGAPIGFPLPVPPVGTHTVSYTAGPPGCTSTRADTLDVRPTPNASLTGPASPVCIATRADSLRLTLATTGGSLSLNGGPQPPPATTTLALAWPPGTGALQLVYRVAQNGCADADTYQATVLAPPTANFTQRDTALCANATGLNWAATPTGGQWTLNGVPTTFPRGVPAVGNYQVRYTLGPAGCADTLTDSLRVFPLPNPALTGFDSTFCAGQPDTLRPTPADTAAQITFNTQPLPPGGQPIPAQAGTYALRSSVTSTQGCTASRTYVITVDPVPNPSLIGLKPAYCMGERQARLTLNPGAPGATQNLFLSGQPVASTFALPTTSGTYPLVHQASSPNGCIVADTYALVVLPKPWMGFRLNQTTFCAGQDSVRLVPDLPAQTLWQGQPAGFPRATPTLPGTYQLALVRDTLGCPDTAQAVIDVLASALPPAMLPADTTLCLGDTLTFPPTPGWLGYARYRGDSLPLAALQGGLRLPSIPADDTLLLVAQNGNCKDSLGFRLRTVAPPDPAFFGLDSSYCPGSPPIELQVATQGGTLAMNGRALVGLSVAMPDAGTHRLSHTVATVPGCTATTAASFRVLQPPASGVAPTQRTACQGQPIALAIQQPQPGVRYRLLQDADTVWLPQSPPRQPNPGGYAPGAYRWVVQAQLPPCPWFTLADTAWLRVIPPPAVPTWAQPLEVQYRNDGNLHLHLNTAGTYPLPDPATAYTLAWPNGDTLHTTWAQHSGTWPVAVPPSLAGATPVWLRAQDNGCVSARQDTLHLQEVLPLPLPTAFSPNNDGRNDAWTWVLPPTRQVRLTLRDRTGRLVYQATGHHFRWDGQCPTGNPCPEGWYAGQVQALDNQGLPPGVSPMFGLTLVR